MWGLWEILDRWYKKTKKNVTDVRRLYWSTYDLHRTKPFVNRHALAVKDTAKTLHKYVTLRTPRILHENERTCTYLVPININHVKYKLTFAVEKNSMSKICGAWGIGADGARQNILPVINQYAGPNEEWLQNVTPEMLGWHSIQVNFLDRETFDVDSITYGATEKMRWRRPQPPIDPIDRCLN